MNGERAQVIGLQALAWLVGNDELCPIFLGSTGGSADDLRGGASDPAVLAAVLDFITMDDAWVISFCDSAGLAYEDPLHARHALPGAEQVHWT